MSNTQQQTSQVVLDPVANVDVQGNPATYARGRVLPVPPWARSFLFTPALGQSVVSDVGANHNEADTSTQRSRGLAQPAYRWGQGEGWIQPLNRTQSLYLGKPWVQVPIPHGATAVEVTQEACLSFLPAGAVVGATGENGAGYESKRRDLVLNFADGSRTPTTINYGVLGDLEGGPFVDNAKAGPRQLDNANAWFRYERGMRLRGVVSFDSDSAPARNIAQLRVMPVVLVQQDQRAEFANTKHPNFEVARILPKLGVGVVPALDYSDAINSGQYLATGWADAWKDLCDELAAPILSSYFDIELDLGPIGALGYNKRVGLYLVQDGDPLEAGAWSMGLAVWAHYSGQEGVLRTSGVAEAAWPEDSGNLSEGT